MARAEWLNIALTLAASVGTSASASEPASVGASAPKQARAAHAALRAGVPPAQAANAWVSVWVELELPELASLPREQRVERDALRLKILAQQEAVMARLRDLGAVEQARVQQVRNALAVRLPSAQIEAARGIPGVRAVRLVRHVDRGPLVRGG